MTPTREACAFENAAPFAVGMVIGLLVWCIVSYRVVKALSRSQKPVL